MIADYGLEKNVFLYGSRLDIENILNQAAIAVLTSQSEGLPVALLEYGLYKKSVVVTNVVEIPTIVENGKNGFLGFACIVRAANQCQAFGEIHCDHHIAARAVNLRVSFEARKCNDGELGLVRAQLFGRGTDEHIACE